MSSLSFSFDLLDLGFVVLQDGFVNITESLLLFGFLADMFGFQFLI